MTQDNAGRIDEKMHMFAEPFFWFGTRQCDDCGIASGPVTQVIL